MVHNKWSFALHASDMGLQVPETFLVGTTDELLLAFSQWRKLIIKPVYSRFATRTLYDPTIKEALTSVSFDSATHWVAQELIVGREICTYSVAHHGRLTAHAAYCSDFTAGRGATIVFQPIAHQAAFDWVQRFVAASGLPVKLPLILWRLPTGRSMRSNAIRAPQAESTCSLRSRNLQMRSWMIRFRV
jgi:hypothetical protein